MDRYDIIVIGGGVNSLVTASILGKSGKKVLLLESRDSVGGLASTEEFEPGFKCNLINDSIKWIDPRVKKQLDLGTYGLEMVTPDLVRIALDRSGKHIKFYSDPDQTATSIANHSEKDAKAWAEFTRHIDSLSQFFEKLYELTPPKFPDVGLREALTMRSMLTPIRKHGTRGLVDLMRLVPMMMQEFMDEWFETDLLRGALSSAGINHISQGPFSAATGYNLLHQHVHANGVFHNMHFIKGGTGNLTNTLLKSAQENAVKIRTNANVRSIDVENGICTSVTLSNGETFSAGQFVSGLDPHNTFVDLVGPSELNPKFFTQLRNIKYRGSVSRIHFALNGLPKINGVREDQMNTIFSIGPSIKYLEQAADTAKYGKISKNPFIEFSIPSMINPDFSPSGKHVLSASMQYTPYHLRDQDWSDDLKQRLKNNVVSTLENYIPEISGQIESFAVLSPIDLEDEFCLTEGNLNHGEMTLDQFFFMRPTISTAQYKSPIKNLYLCGPGTHPGGGLHGTNGFNASQIILKGN